MVLFRDYQETDFLTLEKYIFSLYESLFMSDKQGIKITTAKILATLDEFTLKPEKGRFIVFEVDQVMIGYALLVFYWSMEYGGNFVLVDELFVEENYRNQGIGAVFFQWLENELQGKAIGMILEVKSSDHRALKLYERLGFLPAIRPHYFKLLSF